MKQRIWIVGVVGSVLIMGSPATVFAQTEPPAQETAGEDETATPSVDDIEPGVSTSPSAGVTRRQTNTGVIDELDLSSTRITGNQELPKVLYIVPWKQADLGDLVGRPVNTLLDEVLEPVDRDVFRRQNKYYESLYGTATESDE